MQNSTCLIESNLDTFPENIRLTARSLGVVFDSDLTFTTHINKVVWSCFFRIRTIAKIIRLTQSDLEK